MALVVPAIHASGLCVTRAVVLMARGRVFACCQEDVDYRHKAAQGRG
jgi:hypothetical protein